VKHVSHEWAMFLAVILLCLSSAAQQSPANSSSPAPAAGAEQQTKTTPAPDEATDKTSKAPTASEPQDKPAAAMPAGAPPGIDLKTGKPLYETIKENWASLSVKGSELEPEPPVLGEVDDEPTFTRTLVSLKWRPGDPLDVYIVMPKGVTKPPVVLYLYSYLEDTDRFKDNRWCERVTHGGVAAVGFVSALSGHRFHDRPLKQWFVSELQESLGSTVHDVKFILDYLASHGEVDMNRIGMFGQGSGGAIAVLAAAADPRIKAIDVFEPWGDWPVWLANSSVVQDDPDKDRYTTKDFLKKVEPLDPVKWLPKLKSTEIRIQQVSDFDANPPECQDKIKKAAPKQAKVDRFDSTAQMATIEGGGRLFDWIKEQLRKPTSVKPVKTAVAKTTAAPTHSAQP
jgi:Acetyl xylan esterase (AXE1)